MDYKNYTLEEIRNVLNEKELEILDLYLIHTKQKDICIKCDCKRGNIDRLVKKYNLTRFRTRNCYYLNEEKISLNNPEFCYFLGFFAADGNLHTTSSGSNIVQFTLKDKEPLDNFKKLLEYTGEVKIYSKKVLLLNKNTGIKEKVPRDYYYLGITNKKLVEILYQVFKEPKNKTYTLRFPKFEKLECNQMFLRGFWDGDGSFAEPSYKGYKNKFYEARMHCASDEFINGFSNLMDSLNIYYVKRKTDNIWSLEITNKKDVYNFIKYLYEYKSNIWLTRKAKRALTHIKNLKIQSDTSQK